MPEILNKVKHAISGHHEEDSHDTRNTGTHDTYGSPHNTSGYDASPNTHGPSTGAGGYGSGPGTSGLNSGPGYGTHGSATGAGAGAYGTGSQTSSIYGSSNTGNYGSSNLNARPRESNLVNEVDPRVDSDRDHRRSGNSQFPSHGSLGNNSTQHPTGGHNYGSSNPISGSDTYGSSTHDKHTTGEHGFGSNNPVSGRESYGNSTHHGHTTGEHGHGSNNPISGREGYGSSTHHGHTAGDAGGHGLGSNNPVSGRESYGSSTNGHSSYNQNTSKTGKTTGPHGSDLLNKLDPRVDEKSNPISQQRSGY